MTTRARQRRIVDPRTVRGTHSWFLARMTTYLTIRLAAARDAMITERYKQWINEWQYLNYTARLEMYTK